MKRTRKPEPENRPILTRVPDKTLTAFDALARKARRTRADYLRLIVEEVVRRNGLSIGEAQS
jgi:predicted DNA-binding protein